MSIGKIGTADLAAGVNTLLGTLNTDAIVNVVFVNRGTTEAKVRTAFGTGANPANADWVEYDTPIPANGVLERTGVAASNGEKIWAYSDTANVTVRAHCLPAND